MFEHEGGSQPIKSLRLLLVEDDELFGRAVIRTLATRHYEVLWLRSCAEARDLLERSSPAQFDCALIDDRLPDGFGMDLLPLLELLEPTPAAILFTASISDDRALAALRAHRLMLPKPRTPSGVLEMVAVIENGRPPEPVPKASAAWAEDEFVFGSFVLHAHGLSTPTGPIALVVSSVAILRFLLTRFGYFTSGAEMARDLLGRYDAAGPVRVRRHIADTRRALGSYGWLIESAPKRGYRVTSAAFGESPSRRAESNSRIPHVSRARIRGL